MTTLGERPTITPVAAPAPRAPRQQRFGRTFVKWVTSTDHKTIAYMYMITAMVFFLLGGLMAMIIRAELAEPGQQRDQLFLLGNQRVDFGGFAVEEPGDGGLLFGRS